jgi:D-serine deaminase-like pyridoxal phosphate-dependent protein
VYLFGDLFQAGLGSCTVSDIALSVLSTVVSRSGDRVVLDAGGLALSKDRSTRGTDWDAGYGRLLSLEGAPLDAIVADVHQEHGEVHGAPADLRVGDRVRVLPNHACMTGAAYGRYHVVQGTRVVHTWDRVNGW